MANKVIQMKDKYKSTNKEFPFIIGDCFTDDADKHVEKIIEDNIVANPTPAGGETTLAYLEIGGTKYAIPVPTNVIANPELIGTEAELGSIQIGDTKYKIGGGKQLYMHLVHINKDIDNVKITAVVNIITDDSTAFTMANFKTYISDTLTNGGIFVASGTYWTASDGVCFIHSLKKAAGVPTFSAHKQNTTMMAGSSVTINIGSDYSNLHITDNVIAL